MGTYSFYPGCSLHSTGLEYGLSTQAVFRHLELALVELPDWNCCGASSAHALDRTLALNLPARNLTLAQAAGRDLVIACAACFNRLKNADYLLNTAPRAGPSDDRISIRPLLGVLLEDVGLTRISAKVQRPLTGLKVVTYYGCLLVRPPEVMQFDDPDAPHGMADLLRALGATVMAWSETTECCGGGLSLGRPDIVSRLVTHLVDRAREAGAEALVTACPLCQVNLEMRQSGYARLGLNPGKLPAFYFTELLGLAFGLKEARQWWGKHLIDPRPQLRRVGLLE